MSTQATRGASLTADQLLAMRRGLGMNDPWFEKTFYKDIQKMNIIMQDWALGNGGYKGTMTYHVEEWTTTLRRGLEGSQKDAVEKAMEKYYERRGLDVHQVWTRYPEGRCLSIQIIQ